MAYVYERFAGCTVGKTCYKVLWHTSDSGLPVLGGSDTLEMPALLPLGTQLVGMAEVDDDGRLRWTDGPYTQELWDAVAIPVLGLREAWGGPGERETPYDPDDAVTRAFHSISWEDLPSPYTETELDFWVDFRRQYDEPEGHVFKDLWRQKRLSVDECKRVAADPVLRARYYMTDEEADGLLGGWPGRRGTVVTCERTSPVYHVRGLPRSDTPDTPSQSPDVPAQPPGRPGSEAPEAPGTGGGGGGTLDVIALCGAAGAGKDTLALALAALKGFTNLGFGQPMKLMSYMCGLAPGEIQKELGSAGLTERWAWQQLGTECREAVGASLLWAQFLLARLHYLSAVHPKPRLSFVVPDLRYSHEHEALSRYVRGRGGRYRLWRVVRPGQDYIKEQHSSEAYWRDLPAEAEVVNDGTVLDLAAKGLALLGERLPLLTPSTGTYNTGHTVRVTHGKEGW